VIAHNAKKVAALFKMQPLYAFSCNLLQGVYTASNTASTANTPMQVNSSSYPEFKSTFILRLVTV